MSIIYIYFTYVKSKYILVLYENQGGEIFMSLDTVKQYFHNMGLDDRIIQFSDSTATVALAAEALGCEEARIAKTMSFLLKDRPIVVVTAGDVKIDNKKYKDTFGVKAKMVPYDQVEEYIGHAPGGVCPFVLNKDVSVYLDISLKKFDIVYPAAGDSHSAVKLSPDELEKLVTFIAWVDVCKGWEKQ